MAVSRGVCVSPVCETYEDLPKRTSLKGHRPTFFNLCFMRDWIRTVMPDLSQIIQISAAHAWFYLPVAVILGALHALEPGHAKSLMAAYIIAIRGTSGQAALLGLSAAAGHTIVVWILAVAALLF